MTAVGHLFYRALLGALLALVVSAGVAGAAAQRLSIMSLESQYICVSCHEPLELVSSPQAESEKAFLQGLLAKGDTQSQINRAMVNAYSVAVLAKPPAHGFNLTVYILPPAILVVGIGFLVWTLPKWRERSRRAAVTPMAGAPPLQAADAERLDEELEHFI